MREELDLSRSKRPQMVPEEKDIGDLQLQIDKLKGMIEDASVMEELLDGSEHSNLVIIQKRRIFDIIEESLKRQLTNDNKDIAYHNEVRGRLRESFDVLGRLETTRAYKTGLESKSKGLIATMRNWGNRISNKSRSK